LGVYEYNVNSFLHREGWFSGSGTTWSIGKISQSADRRAQSYNRGLKIQEKKMQSLQFYRGSFVGENCRRNRCRFRIVDGANVLFARWKLWWRNSGRPKQRSSPKAGWGSGKNDGGQPAAPSFRIAA
jgi:hypothetical protein